MGGGGRQGGLGSSNLIFSAKGGWMGAMGPKGKQRRVGGSHGWVGSGPGWVSSGRGWVGSGTGWVGPPSPSPMGGWVPPPPPLPHGSQRQAKTRFHLHAYSGRLALE